MSTLPGSRTRTGLGLAATAAVAATTAVLTLTPASETVAAFADREFGIATFSATKLNLQGNATANVALDSPGWSDHFTAGAAAVFEPAIGNLAPGSTPSYSRFGLRLNSSTVNATVKVGQGSQVSPSTQANLFRMRLVRSAAATCDAASFATGATFLVGSAGTAAANYGDMLTTPAGQFTLASSGTPVYLCFEFSLPNPPPAGLTNGAIATVRWTITAESIAAP